MIATDDKHYWRREKFPPYKGTRKADREKSQLDWPTIFNAISTVRQELEEYFPYRVIQVVGAEADDIIATLARTFCQQEKIVIVSADKDFVQLLRYTGVSLYSPLHDELKMSDETRRLNK